MRNVRAVASLPGPHPASQVLAQPPRSSPSLPGPCSASQPPAQPPSLPGPHPASQALAQPPRPSPSLLGPRPSEGIEQVYECNLPAQGQWLLKHTSYTIQRSISYVRKNLTHVSPPTIVVRYSDSNFSLFSGVHTEAVVPVSRSDQQLVVGRENKEVLRDCQVLGKRTTNILPF